MPDLDLDAIETRWLGDIDATDPYQALLDMRADLAVAVEVARERGEEVERLRAVAEAARQFREAERGGRFAKSDLHSTIAALDRMRDTERALDAALDTWRGGDIDD